MYCCAHKTATLTPIQHTVPPPLISAELEAKPVPSKDLVQTNLTSFLN